MRSGAEEEMLGKEEPGMVVAAAQGKAYLPEEGIALAEGQTLAALDNEEVVDRVPQSLVVGLSAPLEER
jgi:hypothetical protein